MYAGSLHGAAISAADTAVIGAAARVRFDQNQAGKLAMPSAHER